MSTGLSEPTKHTFSITHGSPIHPHFNVMFYPCHGIPQQRSSARSSQSGMPAADWLSTFFAHNLGYPLIHCFSNANRQRPIRGIRKMQHALQFMREGTDSSQESRCRIALIRNGLPCPKVNWKVRLNNGKIALLDMAYPDIKVAIEYDGRHHAGQWLADSKRREALEDDGWAYIQVTAENLMNDFEERALAQRVADRMSQRLSKPIMLCQRMSSGRIHIRITSLANGSRKILI